MTSNDDTHLTWFSWFFAVGFFLGQRELAEQLAGQLRLVEGKLDVLDNKLHKFGHAIEEKGQGFAPSSDSSTVQ